MPAAESSNDPLVRLFYAAAESAAARIRAGNFPLVFMRNTKVVDQSIPGQWGYTVVPSPTNILLHEGILVVRMAPLLSDAVARLVRSCAAALVAKSHSVLPSWCQPDATSRFLTRSTSESPLGDISYEQSTAEWIEFHILLPALLNHLANLPSLAAPEGDIAIRFAEEVLFATESPTLSTVLSFPLAGIEIDSPDHKFTSGNVTLRLLNSGEQSDIADEMPISWSQSWMHEVTSIPTAIVEFYEDVGRDSYIQLGNQPDTFAAALQLHGYRIAGRTAHLSAQPGWLMPFPSYMPVQVPRTVEGSATLTEEKFSKILKVAECLQDYNIDSPHSSQDLALHRFHSGVARDNDVDAVLDFTIALEILLLPYDEDTRRGELSYRFRMHGAHYIADGVHARRKVKNKLSEVYAMRSRLVHGGNYPQATEVSSVRESAYEIARRGLLRAVTEGFPSAATFNEMMLGI